MPSVQIVDFSIDSIDFWQDFALSATPHLWIEQAKNARDVLLLDHAHCEKKATRTALQLIQAYPDNTELVRAMTQLASEELLHFRQVLDAMRERAIRFTNLSGCGYAKALYAPIAKTEPARCIELLIIGALIEARSSERFSLLAQAYAQQDLSLAKYYQFLVKAESRHYLSYIHLATKLCDKQTLYTTIHTICERERLFFTQPCHALRMHSAPLSE